MSALNLVCKYIYSLYIYIKKGNGTNGFPIPENLGLEPLFVITIMMTSH